MTPTEIRTSITCGIPAKATRFSYSGSLESGINLHFETSSVRIEASFLQAILTEFRGKTVQGGFSMTAPKRGGLGIWVRDYSRELNGGIALTPRHASFIAGILRDTDKLTSTTEGAAVILQFRD